MSRGLRRGISLALVVTALAFRLWQRSTDDAAPAATATREGRRAGRAGEQIQDQIQDQLQGQTQGVGVVDRVLPDDNDGSRHQRFILRLADDRTILVAHNVDLAPRLTGLDRGDTVAFFGEFEPNAQGGVIHWTHRDPAGRHVAGWLKHDGRTVQ